VPIFTGIFNPGTFLLEFFVTHTRQIKSLPSFLQRARRGGGGGGGFRSRAPARPVSRPASRPASTAAPRKPAPPTAPAPPAASSVPAPQQSGGGGMLSGIGSTIAQGMAFGTGSAIAHRAVGAAAGAFGGGGGDAEQPQIAENVDQQQQSQMQQGTDVCAYDKKMFYDCLNENTGDQAACDFLYEQLKQCQQNQMQFQ